MLKNINGFKMLSVGEYVKDHYEYFSKNVNCNINDCCNLDIKKTKINFNQLTLF